MRKALPITLLLLFLALPTLAQAQPGWGRSPWDPSPPGLGAPDLSGTWFMHGDPNKPTRIIQRGPGNQALFINEHGTEAWGTIEADRVWVPSWSDGWRRGLVGEIRGNRIIWPNGSYWSRQPRWGGWR